MGCNCKNVKRVEKFIKETNGVKEVEKKGIDYWKAVLLDNLEKVLNSFVVILLLILICPIICIVLIVSYLLKGKFVLVLPPFMFKLYKKAEKKIKEKEISEGNGEKLSN